MKTNVKPRPTIFMIFGGTGDLAARKLIPALFNLFLEKYMPKEFAIIGLGRTSYTDESFIKTLLEGVNKYSRSGKADKDKWKEFSSRISYLTSDVNDEKDYKKMSDIIEKCENDWSEPPVIIHYLAVAPKFFPIIASNLAKVKLADNTDRTRIVVEKPFGHDLASAKELNILLKSIFDETQIYRIDHYLGKETVQNMLAFRFANALFEPIWNRNYIEHVQISVTEDIGVEDRGGYYDGSGALRDMVQNHILQVLCLVAMEPPVNFDAEEIRNRKVDVLRAMRPFANEEIRFNTVRGQYGDGWVQGEKVEGYREENGVDPESNTETFAALKFFIDNWRWQNVPFYVRTGKRMHQKSSIISIQFKDVPHLIFPSQSSESWQQNRLIISIQPEMSIRLQVQAKRPGLDMTLNPVDMVFNYDGTYENETPEAYETLLLDAMKGDQTLFMRGDQVETAWDLLMPVLENWESRKSISFPNYSSDSWGPETAEALIAKDGFHWFTLPIKKGEKK
ncbi:MAG: glucose-6-phosphate dehydrogenase [Bacteroidetes bacterium]|nr:glucose-6-phosphate dehydrogenase [Bacteroidota bacterium]MBU1485247.1 glucose-6-phosphate dehydrogenase [Bacteroidota bacterium]MBU2045431.1 glucose-6-phosphate dehydrogenase [Bacteroidota bacterium]MBU2267791.1 glucose-6-phosphate dehydrogenase [Bacteroidota bacterium]MBU2375449.1 glucose-6-phosphate dehydrogenase [Bacteroidota bacterium]